MTSFQTADRAAEHVAAEVRAEMARQRKMPTGLAEVLNLTKVTAQRRLDGSVPFNVVELVLVADWLGVDATNLMPAAIATATA